MSNYLRQHLGAKHLTSYLAIIVVGVLVVEAASASLSLVPLSNRKVVAFGLSPPAKEKEARFTLDCL